MRSIHVSEPLIKMCPFCVSFLSFFINISDVDMIVNKNAFGALLNNYVNE